MSSLPFLTLLFTLLILCASGITALPTRTVIKDPREFAQRRTYFDGCPLGSFLYQDECQPIYIPLVLPTENWLSCPVGWTWKEDKYQCWPRTRFAVESNLRTCYMPGHIWLEDNTFCAVKNKAASSADSCDDAYQWYWQGGSLCCARGEFSDEKAMPHGQSCPPDFYYTNAFGCIPKGPDNVDQSCEDGLSWDSNSFVCHGVSTPSLSPAQCSDNEFWWPLGLSCISINAISEVDDSSPDPDRSCPTNLDWSPSAGHCIPTNEGSIWPSLKCSDPTHTWRVDKLYCVGVVASASSASQCSNAQFYWQEAELCVSWVHSLIDKIPDKNKSCPLNFAWCKHADHCIPNTQFDSVHLLRCSNRAHIWDAAQMACTSLNASGSSSWWDN